jgi:hypothetical protein
MPLAISTSSAFEDLFENADTFAEKRTLESTYTNLKSIRAWHAGTKERGEGFGCKTLRTTSSIFSINILSPLVCMDPETWPAWPQLTLYLAERTELLTSDVVKCVTISDQYRLLQRCEGWQRAFENEESSSLCNLSTSESM